MAKPFGEELKYYKNYMDLFYGSKSYLSPYEVSLFGGMEKQIERRREKLTDVSLESAARRGVLASGVTDKYITETVTEPIETAHAKLGMEKMGVVSAEKKRRHGEALRMAIARVQREREESKGLWGTIGKIAGTAAGIGASFIPGVAPVALPFALRNLTSLFDMGDDDWADIQEMIRQMELETEEEEED
jgi:hypothetical protein